LEHASGDPVVAAAGVHDIRRAPKTREEIKESPWYQDLQTPKLGPGEPAFDFSLPILDAAHGATAESVRLSTFAGEKPVALIFGSYT